MHPPRGYWLPQCLLPAPNWGWGPGSDVTGSQWERSGLGVGGSFSRAAP